MDSSDTRPRKSKKKPPSPRRDGREAALQYLYSNDIQGEVDFSEEKLEQFWTIRQAKSFAQEFATEILKGVERHSAAIDEEIRPTLENYAFQRLTAVDRNILRIGAYEILYADHIPPQAAINEAIEIAKRFGNEESPKFVNGILDKILKNSQVD